MPRETRDDMVSGVQKGITRKERYPIAGSIVPKIIIGLVRQPEISSLLPDATKMSCASPMEV